MQTSLSCIKSPQASWENIPDELKTRLQWVLWRKENRKGKITKPPYQVNGKLASTTNQKTWDSFKNVIEAYCKGSWNGIGYVFSVNDPFCGNDFDHCITETGEIKEPARTWIYKLNSYTEISQSGTGIHVLSKAKLSNGKGYKNPELGFEMYDQGRFFALTGVPLNGYKLTIEDRQKEVDDFYEEIFDKPSPQTPKAPIIPINTKVKPTPSLDTKDLSDDEIIRIGLKEKSIFSDLWNGNWIPHFSPPKSQSEADESLCWRIAFYTKDPARIDSIFRRSGLYRAKWDREDYRTSTINKALSKQTGSYSGKKGKGKSSSPPLQPLPSGSGKPSVTVSNQQLRDVSNPYLPLNPTKVSLT